MDLNDAEINEICGGLIQNHAKIRFLLSLGLTVRRKPNGKPLVNRQHYQTVMTSAEVCQTPFSTGPKWRIAA